MSDCYLCSSSDLELVRDRLRHGVVRKVFRCSGCGLVFLEPRNDDLRSYYGTEYRKQYSPRTDQVAESRAIFDIYRPLQGERVARLEPYLPSPDGRALDVGCSAGHFLDALRGRVAECVGIEFNLANVEFVRKELGFEAFSVPIEETGLPKASFDLITCFHAMEHMPDPRGFLESLKPYLRPGGRVYVEVPNVEDALLSVYFSEPYADFWYREPHLFNFSPQTLTRLMTDAGYRGDVLPVQRYSLSNHLHWNLLREPQASASDAMVPPALATDERAPASVRDALNRWFARVDAEYRALLSDHLVCESVGFAAEVAR